MALTGVEVPLSTLSNIPPNTILAVITDAQGTAKVVQIDCSSIAADQAFLRVTTSADGEQPGGCWVMVYGVPVWKDPCPY
jgi:hypothetical protein